MCTGQNKQKNVISRPRVKTTDHRRKYGFCDRRNAASATDGNAAFESDETRLQRPTGMWLLRPTEMRLPIPTETRLPWPTETRPPRPTETRPWPAEMGFEWKRAAYNNRIFFLRRRGGTWGGTIAGPVSDARPGGLSRGAAGAQVLERRN
jgi:hypothetical protein